ncbi:MAG: restriction endonuclease subunit S [Flavobacterium sp.]|nr:restriction endonuclease subunit S [Flavobacterium sp.]
MFGDPGTNPKGWEVKTWGDVLKIVNGRNQSQVISEDGEYPIIGSGGEMGRANNFLCPENTVVIGRKGNINKPLLIKEKFWNVDTAFGLVPKSNSLTFNYLYWFCIFFNFEKLNKTVTIPSLTKTDLLEIRIPIPDKKIQDKFDQIVQKITGIKYQQTSGLSLTNASFNALSNKLFQNEN